MKELSHTYYKPELLQKMRESMDFEADEVIKQILQDPNAPQILAQLNKIETNQALKEIDKPDFLVEFIAQNQQLPTWADTSKMANAQKFFAQNVQLIMSMLGFLSLPYCYAGANGVQVLYLSKRVREDVQNRLRETGQFVWEVMQVDAFAPNGKGLVNILKVRLLHATIRYRLFQSKDWNFDWGMPINQMDMAGTNLAFSWICLRGLRKVGITIDSQTGEDFLHLWNVIGYLSGVKMELLPQNAKEAFWLDKRIAESEFKTSEAGQALTHSLLKFLSEVTQKQFPAGFAPTYMRFLLGESVANILAIPQGDWTFSLVRLLQGRNIFQSIFPDWQNSENEQIKQVFGKEAVNIVLPN
jgi:hypothetical protein